mmetsp:Transcript_37620/g.90372  ORF Transcript_37620/g.90372 Transcript_37620/m.90372 type:complete len:201 (-) Transcript_37620:101-703(-)
MAITPINGTQAPPSACLSMKAPDSTHGTTRMMHGVVPNSIWAGDKPRIPVMTDVGQSGPPHRIPTLARVNPGSSRICSMARTATLSTPTNLRTVTWDPSMPPMMTCWVHTAANFNAYEQITPIDTPKANPNEGSLCPRAPSIMPPVTYTGIPGTTGIRNMENPTRKNTSATSPKESSSSSPLSQDKKMKVSFATPTDITK